MRPGGRLISVLTAALHPGSAGAIACPRVSILPILFARLCGRATNAVMPADGSLTVTAG
jgi:hypothetical protein